MDNKNFWKRVDDLVVTSGMNYKVLSEKSGIPYITIMNQKNQYSRLPKLEDALSLAQALGVSVEYLLTGKEPAPRYARIQDIIDWLMAKSDAELDVFRQYNHVPREKEQSYSSRQEA